MTNDALCSAYVAEVMKFRKALNLTSIDDAKVFTNRFIRPSLALLPFLPECGRLLDIGSGMGVPGIPLLMARPRMHGLLVERRQKRGEFLRHVVRKLALDAEVFRADVRDLEPMGADVCVARAVTHESELLQMCTPHMIDGGIAVLPVPRTAKPVSVAGWILDSELGIDSGSEDGDGQMIRCYRYG